MSDLEVFGPRSLTIVSVATRRAGESPVRPIARIGRCASTQPPTIPLRKATFGVEEQRRENPGYAGDEREQSRSCEAKTVDFSALCGTVTGFGTPGSQDDPDPPSISTNIVRRCVSVLILPTDRPTDPPVQAAASNSNLRWLQEPARPPSQAAMDRARTATFGGLSSHHELGCPPIAKQGSCDGGYRDAADP